MTMKVKIVFNTNENLYFQIEESNYRKLIDCIDNKKSYIHNNGYKEYVINTNNVCYITTYDD